MMENISNNNNGHAKIDIIAHDNFLCTKSSVEHKTVVNTVVSQEPEYSNYIYTVSDSAGFLAAFPSKESAKQVLQRFLKLDLLWHKFSTPRLVKKDDIVYTLPYRNGGHLAYANIEPDSVKSLQDKLLKVDLVHGDDIKYWAFPLSNIVPDGIKRLQIGLMLAIGLTDEQKKMLAENEKLIADAAKMVQKDFDTKPESIDCNLVDCLVSEESVGNLN